MERREGDKEGRISQDRIETAEFCKRRENKIYDTALYGSARMTTRKKNRRRRRRRRGRRTKEYTASSRYDSRI